MNSKLIKKTNRLSSLLMILKQSDKDPLQEDESYLAFNSNKKDLCELTSEISEIQMKKNTKLEKRIKKHYVDESRSTLSSSISASVKSSSSLNKIKDVCLIEESPFYIHKIAQTDRFTDFKRLYNEDPSRIYLKDNSKNWLPVHHAVSKSKTKILDFLIDECDPNMLNTQDLSGNTPLHIAIEKGLNDCVLYLLNKGADPSIKNKDMHASIHQCVISNRPDILDLLLSHENRCDVHLGGENGGTALHTCAYLDNLECAKVLVKHKSNLCKPCSNGFFPIHVAAQRCSNKVLEFLIGEGCKIGCNKLRMLSFVDGDNNKPLHAAVQFGNIGAVKLCLENGATIDEIIEIDKSTPVHIACAQGSFEILRLMAQTQPDLFMEVVHATDSMQMTPLHKAAMFDHIDIAAYLLEKSAFIDALDKEKRSPLLLAASRNCVKMVCYLLAQGSSIKLKDSRLRNLIHLVIDQDSCSQQKDLTEKSSVGQFKVSSMSALERITTEVIKKENYLELLNEQDINGCTVIHYASKYGYVNCLKLLISYGANIAMKNNDKQSPLHFAAKYGRYASCLQILNSENFKNHLNEKDSNGMTPLHLAAKNGHTRVVQMLMQKGALIYKSYGNGNNPFHEAAVNGYTNCMRIIYSIDPYVLNSLNKDGVFIFFA